MSDLLDSFKTYLFALGAWLSTMVQSADACLDVATRVLVFVAVAVRLVGTDLPAARQRFRKWRTR